MNVLIIVGGFIVTLFVMAYFTKRRFGVLGLALAGGATLSGLWARDLTPYIERVGVNIIAPPMETVVAAGMTLLPAIILLFSGPSYSKKSQRVIGAGAFALLAVAFLLEPLGNALVITGEGVAYYTWLTENRIWIITAGLLFALFDILTVKTPKLEKSGH